ncbi:MAG: cupin domain-containing protein [Verrucomicrobia bacterium]|nr:cupin domain-containing protein [Verrucomicrobiota bacterium]
MLQLPDRPANRRRQAIANKDFQAPVKKYFTLLIALPNLAFWLLPTAACAREPQIKVEQILQATQSWDSSPYPGYPTGQPQVTVLRITIPPRTALHWHRHPVISVGYVLSGHLTLEKRDTGERTILQPGQAVAETVQTTHRGFTTDEPVELIVFYAGQVGLPLTINEE